MFPALQERFERAVLCRTPCGRHLGVLDHVSNDVSVARK